PDMRSGRCIDQLRVHAHMVLIALYGAFQRIAHAKLLADLLDVYVLPLESESRIAGDYETAWNARQVSGQILGDAVSKVILVGIVREVGKRQHHERQASNLW